MKHLLNNDFYLLGKITSYYNKEVLKETIDNSYEITRVFQYKENYLEVSSQFVKIGITETLKIPIYSFGYSVNVGYLKVNNYGTFKIKTFLDIKNDNGQSNKKYFDNLKSRNILFKYIHKDCKIFVENVKFPIIVRGVINQFKKNNYRYIAIDEYLQQYYDKTIIIINKNTINDNDIFIKKLNKVFEHYIQNEDEYEFWIYTLKNYLFLKNEIYNSIFS